jgi:hypothetical protein
MIYAQNPLLIVTQAAGILLLLSVVWLLSKGRIYLDSETKKPVSFEVPLFGKIQSQSPVIVLVLIAAGLVAYPATRTHDQIKQATVEGNVETNGTPVTVTVVMVPKDEVTVMSSGKFTIRVPLMDDTDYRARFTVNKQVQIDQGLDVSQSHVQLLDFKYDGTPGLPPVAAKKDISDDKVKNYGIPY